MACLFNHKVDQNVESYTEGEAHIARSSIQLLILGAHGSGKSTVARAVKLFTEAGLSEIDRTSFKEEVRKNIVHTLVDIVSTMDETGLQFTDDDLEENIRLFCKLAKNPKEDSFLEMVDLMNCIVSKLPECLLKKDDHRIIDMETVPYLKRFLGRFQLGIWPNEEDIMRIKLKSISITETLTTYKTYRFRLYEVNSNPNCLRRWLPHFDYSLMIVFCASIDEYSLFNTDNSNKLLRMIEDFECICNDDRFCQSGVLIMLTKLDIFKNKIKQIPLTHCFPDYKGDQSWEDSVDYIKKQFENVNKRGEPEQKKKFLLQNVYTIGVSIEHVEDIGKQVIDCAIDVIVRKNVIISKV